MAALCVTILVSATCLFQGAAAPTTLAERLIVTARADVFVLCWLAAAIGNVARLRFFSADDIAGSGSAPTQSCRTRSSRWCWPFPSTLRWRVLVASSVPLIEALAALFATGCFLFWIGYARGAKSRALGFALTTYPSLAGLIIVVLAAVRLPL
ncbi:MAPEG family protein [Sphingomonas sp.]|uniref:MAPEG family protein n=1 Tax=Sphingomonas sp. TaxID=28214 RepID=UPI003AFFA4F5